MRGPLFKFLSRRRCVPLAPLLLLPALMLCAGVAQADIYRSLDRDPPVFTNVPTAEGRWELFIKDPTDAPASPARENRRPAVFSNATYASHIEAAATAHNIDPALIRAVISAESGYNPLAVSRAGAVGLMQLMPQTASRYSVTNMRDPEQNINGGTRYLRDLLDLFNYDLRLAIAAYNAGEQAVIKYGNRIPPYAETMAYVPKVMKFYEHYRNGKPAQMQQTQQRVSTALKKSSLPAKASVMSVGNAAMQVADTGNPEASQRVVTR
jgi:soluble lytic murein transglycosylase-like protein